MAGAAVRGISKILRKGLRKSPVLGGRVKGAPTFTAKRRIMGGLPKVKSKIKKTAKETGKKALYITAGYFGVKKSVSDAKKRHEAKKKKLEESTKEHKKKTKEQKEKAKE